MAKVFNMADIFRIKQSINAIDRATCIFESNDVEHKGIIKKYGEEWHCYDVHAGSPQELLEKLEKCGFKLIKVY